MDKHEILKRIDDGYSVPLMKILLMKNRKLSVYHAVYYYNIVLDGLYRVEDIAKRIGVKEHELRAIARHLANKEPQLIQKIQSIAQHYPDAKLFDILTEDMIQTSDHEPTPNTEHVEVKDTPKVGNTNQHSEQFIIATEDTIEKFAVANEETLEELKTESAEAKKGIHHTLDNLGERSGNKLDEISRRSRKW